MKTHSVVDMTEDAAEEENDGWRDRTTEQANERRKLHKLSNRSLSSLRALFSRGSHTDSHNSRPILLLYYYYFYYCYY